MDSHPNSPWYSESLSPGFRRRKRRIPISIPNQPVSKAVELNIVKPPGFIPRKVPCEIQLNPIHSTAQSPNDTQPHEVYASTLMGRRGTPLTVNGTLVTDMSNPPIGTSSNAHSYSGSNAVLKPGNIHGSFPLCVHCKKRHSLGICRLTNIIQSRINNHSKQKHSGCTSNKENSQSENYGSQRAEGNKITRNILCSPGPFCDITNRSHSQPIRKQKRTLDRSLIFDVQNNLFPDRAVLTPTKLLDYENIEQSDIVGFSDSEADSEAGDSVHSDSDANVDEGTTLTEHKAWCARMISEVPPEYDTLGAPDAVCSKCGAQMWKEERNNKDVTKGLPEFSLCCKGGRLILPPIQPTPPFLQRLYDNKHRGPAFKRCIRMYNSMFSFTSMGGHVDDSINKGGAPYTYRLNGQNHHQIGALLPTEGDPPKFCQLYIYDTDNEVENRMRWIEVKDCDNVDRTVVEGLLKMLDESNHLVKCFRMARDRFKNEDIIDLKIVLKQSRSESGRENHMSTSDEAAIMIGDADDTCGRRDIVIESKIDGLQRISDIHPLLMALQYPLLFPYGEDGFHENIYFIKQPGDSDKVRETASMREFYCNTLMVRLAEGQTLRMGGRLWQQYVVDSFSSVEQARLWYYRSNQTQLRNELYSHICDYMKEGDGDLSNIGRSYILPASFVGSRRYMQQNFQDALAVCRFIGHPDLFLTMTCNPMWDEVLQMLALLPACKPSDCPDIIARVFKLKLQQLTDDIKKKNFFGKCIAVMYVVEWQKRGLPHVHMLIWLDGASKTYLNRNVDKFVSAEIPNPQQDPAGYAAVKLFMIHGPCGLQRSKSPCMKNKRCIRHFPKRYCARTMFDQSGFPLYKRRKTGHTVRVRKAELDNQWVVPYNRELLLRYQCHINVEICNRARCMKYLFKYCLKGSDRATVEIKSKKKATVAEGEDRQIDEINRFFDGRYVCGAEACHRIFAFDIHHRTIGVERLPFHLEGKKSITYRKEEQAKKVIEKEKYRQSKLEAFFNLCNEKVEARQYTYEEIPRYYVWKKAHTKWDLRKQGVQIGRISYTHHSNGELWYMRLLLLKVRGPTSFVDLRTVDGKVYNTYQEACYALGLLDDDKEWDAALKECSNSGMPAQIRNLFVQIIVNNRISDIKQLWSNHWQPMSDDVLHTQKELSGFHDLHLEPQEIQYYALAEIDKVLRSIGKSITDFKQLPQPPISYLETSRQNLVFEETAYDTTEMTAQHNDMRLKLNRQQAEVYAAVLQSVYARKGGMFFVYGSGGCGKTFLWRTIITRLRSESRIVLPVASSGIAATLLMGGRTAHSRFKIPIVLDELSTCSISHKSDIAELLKKTDLIIWDEAPMQHRYAFEALDRTLRDIMKSVNLCRAEIPFGGITVLLGGDFRQILPVVSMGSRSDIVSSCITRSRLWDGCKIFTLNQNMRLNKGCTNEESQCIKKFGEWILDIGDGKGCDQKSNDDETSDRIVTIPPHLCIDADSADINILIERTFPELRQKYNDVKYLSERAILTPTNEIVSHLNDLILDIIPGQSFTYYSADKAEFIGGYNHEIDQAYPTEILNSLRFPGLPAHELKLKPGTLVMLMRNLNQTLGLCNGTRMIVTQCMKNVVECEVITGANIGCKHFIPKMELSPSESKLPFLLVRRQFPLQICYAMTINKSQGQSLEVVGLYLPTDVFTHGQLYVALSRVTSPQGLHIFIDNEHGKTTNLTKNVVYDEVFYNLPKST